MVDSINNLFVFQTSNISCNDDRYYVCIKLLYNIKNKKQTEILKVLYTLYTVAILRTFIKYFTLPICPMYIYNKIYIVSVNIKLKLYVE